MHLHHSITVTGLSIARWACHFLGRMRISMQKEKANRMVAYSEARFPPNLLHALHHNLVVCVLVLPVIYCENFEASPTREGIPYFNRVPA